MLDVTLLGDPAGPDPPRAVRPPPDDAAALAQVVAALDDHPVDRWGDEGAGAVADLLAIAARAGAAAVSVILDPADDHTDRALAPLGFVPSREIRQLRRPLPLGPADPSGPSVTLRPFRPGIDDAAWLRVNHRAFAWHPEQGRMEADDLAARMAEPWFDAEGFLLAERDGALVGFCWTKLHRDADPTLGEIYAVGVDPDHQGGGLGRLLVRAGLDHLSGAGAPVGMLWVEGDNAPALALYADLGFSVHHRTRYYRRPVTPAGTA